MPEKQILKLTAQKAIKCHLQKYRKLLFNLLKQTKQVSFPVNVDKGNVNKKKGVSLLIATRRWLRHAEDVLVYRHEDEDKALAAAAANALRGHELERRSVRVTVSSSTRSTPNMRGHDAQNAATTA